MKQFLNAVLLRLKEIPELKYVDENWGQLDFYKPNAPVKYPAAVIDFEKLYWECLGDLTQNATAEITIEVATLRLSASSGGVSQKRRSEAFEIYEILDKIVLSLHGWTPIETCSCLVRTETAKLGVVDGIKKYQLRFKCQIYDTSTMPKRTKVNPIVSLKYN